MKNPDIVAAVAAREDRPFTVGFAAETRDVINYARQKLVSKNLDLIVANDVSDSAVGFNSDENAVTLVWKDGEQTLSQAGKPTIARQILEKIVELATR